MDKPEVRIDFGGKGQHSDGFAYYVPAAGSSIEIDFDDVETHYSVDTSGQDSLKVMVRGTFNVSDIRKGRLLLGSGLGIDVLQSAAPFEGTMTWEIDRNWSVEVRVNRKSSSRSAGMGMRLSF